MTDIFRSRLYKVFNYRFVNRRDTSKVYVKCSRNKIADYRQHFVIFTCTFVDEVAGHKRKDLSDDDRTRTRYRIYCSWVLSCNCHTTIEFLVDRGYRG